MKLSIFLITAGIYGGIFKGNLRYFITLVNKELESNGFTSSFQNFEIQLYYPPMFVVEGIKGMEINFLKYYDSQLPMSRLERKKGRVSISLQAPEFSEHLQGEESKGKKYQFEIEDQYKNLSEEHLATVILDKYIEAARLIKPKLKKEDNFDVDNFISILSSIYQKINSDLLKQIDEVELEFLTFLVQIVKRHYLYSVLNICY